MAVPHPVPPRRKITIYGWSTKQPVVSPSRRCCLVDLTRRWRHPASVARTPAGFAPRVAYARLEAGYGR